MSDAPKTLQAELLEARRALGAIQAELFKTQIVAATRLDVIRLLGFCANRTYIPDLPGVLPKEPEARALLALEVQELAEELRRQSAHYDKLAAELVDGG